MKTLVCVLLLGLTLSAQEVSAPTPDVELVASWQLNVQLAEKALAKADAVLRKTPEYKEYEDAKKLTDSIRQAVQGAAAQRYPGFTLDLKTGKLIPQHASK